MFVFAEREKRMKTNRIMDEIRGTIPPALKMQMELSVAIANRIYDILKKRICRKKTLPS